MTIYRFERVLLEPTRSFIHFFALTLTFVLFALVSLLGKGAAPIGGCVAFWGFCRLKLLSITSAGSVLVF